LLRLCFQKGFNKLNRRADQESKKTASRYIT
jgi:hypothetical protein